VPSLLKIAGIEAPADVVFDGEDFSNVILGKAMTQERKTPILWRRPPDRPGPENDRWPELGLRDENWTFLMQFDGSRPQLYDLTKDVSEANNLAGQHPERVEKYKKLLFEWNQTLPKDAGEQRR